MSDIPAVFGEHSRLGGSSVIPLGLRLDKTLLSLP